LTLVDIALVAGAGVDAASIASVLATHCSSQRIVAARYVCLLDRCRHTSMQTPLSHSGHLSSPYAISISSYTVGGSKTSQSRRDPTPQMVCGLISGRSEMNRAIMLAVTAIVAVGLSAPVHAQKSVQQQMDEMKAKNPKSYSACMSLATSRGYRFGTASDVDSSMALMNFIVGCMMGRQR
jgi:hypothetical protein